MNPVPHLDDAQCFDVALRGIEQAHLLDHLEACPDCQLRTTELSGDVERQLLRAVGSRPLPDWLTTALEQDFNELPVEERVSGVVALGERRGAKTGTLARQDVARPGDGAPEKPRMGGDRRLLLDALVLAAAAGVCFLFGAYWRGPAPVAMNGRAAPRPTGDTDDGVQMRTGGGAVTGDVYCTLDGAESAVIGEESQCKAGAPLRASAKRPGAGWRYLAFVVCDPSGCRLVPEGPSDAPGRVEFPVATQGPAGVWAGFFVASNARITEPVLARAASAARAGHNAWPPNDLSFPFLTGRRALRWTLVTDEKAP